MTATGSVPARAVVGRVGDGMRGWTNGSAHRGIAGDRGEGVAGADDRATGTNGAGGAPRYARREEREALLVSPNRAGHADGARNSHVTSSTQSPRARSKYAETDDVPDRRI
jgi:hypothetical protein